VTLATGQSERPSTAYGGHQSINQASKKKTTVI